MNFKELLIKFLMTWSILNLSTNIVSLGRILVGSNRDNWDMGEVGSWAGDDGDCTVGFGIVPDVGGDGECRREGGGESGG